MTYISTELITRDKPSAFADDFHPVYGSIRVRKFVNYFTIANKSFFADAGELPCEWSLIAAGGVDAIIGTDLLKRFDAIADNSYLNLCSYGQQSMQISSSTVDLPVLRLTLPSPRRPSPRCT